MEMEKNKLEKEVKEIDECLSILDKQFKNATHMLKELIANALLFSTINDFQDDKTNVQKYDLFDETTMKLNFIFGIPYEDQKEITTYFMASKTDHNRYDLITIKNKIKEDFKMTKAYLHATYEHIREMYDHFQLDNDFPILVVFVDADPIIKTNKSKNKRNYKNERNDIPIVIASIFFKQSEDKEKLHHIIDIFTITIKNQRKENNKIETKRIKKMIYDFSFKKILLLNKKEEIKERIKIAKMCEIIFHFVEELEILQKEEISNRIKIMEDKKEQATILRRIKYWANRGIFVSKKLKRHI